jgi:hypothetical protein
VEPSGEEFDPVGWYDYTSGESALRVTYSLLVISIHIKILAVLSFFPSVAYLVKIMTRVV